MHTVQVDQRLIRLPHRRGGCQWLGDYPTVFDAFIAARRLATVTRWTAGRMAIAQCHVRGRKYHLLIGGNRAKWAHHEQMPLEGN